jgi:hypothetical protein
MNGRRKAKAIREEKIGNQNKRALIVEGKDDESALTILLQRHHPNWEQRWIIAPAGNKQQVQEVLAVEPDWIGLVDRDEWDQSTIDQRTQRLPKLLVLPRFCIENYLINPTEIWQAIPVKRQATVDGGESAFTQNILAELPHYLRHGVLWKVVTPLWSGLRALGFKDALAAEHSVSTAQDDAEIRRILGDWDQLLDPERIFTEFQQQLSEVQQLSVAEQLALWIHGKTFWKNVVHPHMNRLFGQIPETDMKKDIFSKLILPEDLTPLLERLELV